MKRRTFLGTLTGLAAGLGLVRRAEATPTRPVLTGPGFVYNGVRVKCWGITFYTQEDIKTGDTTVNICVRGTVDGAGNEKGLTKLRHAMMKPRQRLTYSLGDTPVLDTNQTYPGAGFSCRVVGDNVWVEWSCIVQIPAGKG